MISTLFWTLFALLYALMLRHETFFGINRWYLLVALVAGAVLPFGPGEWIAEVLFPGESVAYGLWQAWLPEVAVSGYAASGGKNDVWQTYLLIYGIGVAVVAARLLIGLWRIWLMANRAVRRESSGGCVLLYSEEITFPFSFFGWIFLPENSENNTDMDDIKIRAIIAHEQAHARGWHSADVLVSEIVCIIFWFHPLVWWYRAALRQVHEYLADADAGRKITRKQYGLLLIGQSYTGNTPALVHHFFQSPLKQRLMMLTKQTSPAIRGWKYALALPLLAISIWCCKPENEPTALNVPPPPPPVEIQQSGEEVINASQITKASKKGEDVLDMLDLDQVPSFPGGEKELLKYLATEIKYPQEAMQQNIEGTAAVEFIVEKDGSISTVKIIRDVRSGCGAEAARVVAAMPKWTPGAKDGKPVRVKYVLPVRFKLE